MYEIFIIFLSLASSAISASSPTWTTNPLLNSGTYLFILQANINPSIMATQNLHPLSLMTKLLILPSLMRLGLYYVSTF